MSVKQLVFAVLFASVSLGLAAQESPAGGTYRSFSPVDQWELGVHLGTPLIVGDVDAKFPGFGGGLHVRKSLDHIFSVRVSALYAGTKNESDNITAETNWFSGSLQLVTAINNFRFNKPNRKLLVNAFVGLGVDNFSTDHNIVGQTSPAEGTNLHADFGLGLAYRINPRFNIGLEHTLTTVFGENSDLLDGDQNLGDERTTFRDFFHYPHVSLNFNLGGMDKNGVKKSEPLYWVNPMGAVADAIAALEARPIYDPTDTDGDGIIDAIDDEDNSPANARVDTKGVTLDSDSDKVPDYKDKEPYSPPGYTVNADGVAQVPKPITEADVNRIVDAKLAMLPKPKLTVNWFLPNINFSLNRYDIAYDEYEKLYQVASVLKSNPETKVVVVGHADLSGSEKYNNVLSYNRAKAAIEFLTSKHGIARERLILNYAGEGSALVPAKGASSANRRVEFRVAQGETEMQRPEGPEAGKGRFQGNKDAGF